MGAWEFIEVERRPDSVRFSVARDRKPVSWFDVIDAMQGDPLFASELSEIVVTADFDQLFWETSPLDRDRGAKPFQFALVRARLDSPADSSAFSKFFDRKSTVATFPNLSGSAVLVSPAPLPDAADRSYLKPFLTTAPAAQIRELWRSVGAAVHARVSDKPVWVSTSGGGVPWLHVRLDSSPKYFSYPPFRDWP